MDFRTLIREAIKQRGESIRSFGQKSKAMRLNSLYRYLSGQKDTTGAKLETLFKELGIKVTRP